MFIIYVKGPSVHARALMKEAEKPKWSESLFLIDEPPSYFLYRLFMPELCV